MFIIVFWEEEEEEGVPSLCLFIVVVVELAVWHKKKKRERERGWFRKNEYKGVLKAQQPTTHHFSSWYPKSQTTKEN